MKVLLSTIGTRGDVQPILALALELKNLGHEPSLCVPPNFEEWVKSFNLRCFPIGPDLRRFTAPASSGQPASGAVRAGMVALSREQKRQLAAGTVREQFRVLSEAARNCDLIVAASALQIAARSIAEQRGIPYVFAAYCPAVIPARDHAPVPKQGAPYPRGLPSLLHRMLWKLDERRVNALFLATLNEQRAKLGLAPLRSVTKHIFTARPWLAADPMLAPAPLGTRLEIVQTGAWSLPDLTPLPEHVERFLAEGEAPVYLGFGSMRQVDETGRLLVQAVRAAGVRAILSQGWGNIALIDSAKDLLSIGDVSHERLFARVAAVVHHGGAGTTTAAACAGQPQVIVPHNYDQFYFASRVQQLGVGVSCGQRERLTPGALADALRAGLRPELKARAQSLASRMLRDGARQAAQRLSDEYSVRHGLFEPPRERAAP